MGSTFAKQCKRPAQWILGLTLGAAMLLTLASPAGAQVKSPGRHPHYGVELEPHLVWQWTGDEWSRGDGIGVGLRASIPVIDNGPIRSLNNNLAVTFGIDWAYFDDDCNFRGDRYDDDCDESDFWVPIAVQWNFFITDVISLFPELGLGFRNAVRSSDYCDARDCDDSDLELHLVLWLGARFLVADNIALTVRLGTPSLLFGVSFLL